MSRTISISIPHQLGRSEARRRIEAGFAKLVDVVPGTGGTCTQHWDGDCLTFSVVAVGQTVGGVVNVFDATVTMDIQLPGFLGMLAGNFKDRLQKVGQRLLTKD